MLRPGGVAFLTVPSLCSPWTPVRVLWALYRRIRGRPLVWQRNMRLGRLEHLARGAGLVPERCFHLDVPAALRMALLLDVPRIARLPNPLRRWRSPLLALARRLEGVFPWLGYHAVVVARKP